MAVTADNRAGQVRPARGLMAIVDFATRSHARAVIVLVVVALLNILPGFFAIPPTDRDEARFAQATKQMIESGDYHRHPLPGDHALQEAGRHLLAAGERRQSRAGARHARRDHHHLALSHSVAARRDRSGAADLLGGARIPVAARGGARRPDDGDLHPAQRRRADRQDRRLPAADRGRRHGRDGARLSARAAAQLEGAAAWTVPAIFWTALAAGGAAQGAGDSADRVLDRGDAGDRRPLGALAAGAAAARRRRSGVACWCCPGSSRSRCAPATASFRSRSARTC